MDDKSIKKILVIISKDSFNDVYQGLTLANGALMEGIKAELFFTFNGLGAINKQLPDSLKPSEQMNQAIVDQNLPLIDEYLDNFKAGGGKIFGCKLSMDMLHVQPMKLRGDIDGIISIGEFYDRVETDSQIIFV